MIELENALREDVLVLSCSHLIPANLLFTIRLQPEPPVCVPLEGLICLLVVTVLGKMCVLQNAISTATGLMCNLVASQLGDDR